MALNVKDFKSQEFKWLVKQAEKSAPMRDLLQELEDTWGPYHKARSTLEALYYDYKNPSTESDRTPWD